jgi:hypothetical protein
VAEAYSMGPAGRERLRSNATARLVAAIPYVAGCDEPERTALAHLGTFVLAGTDADRILSTLREAVEAVPCAPMDEIMTAERAGVPAWSD